MKMNFEQLKASFNTYFVEVLKKQYFDFGGRATRKQFWMFNLYVFVIVLVLSFLTALIGLQIIGQLAVLAIVVPSIAMSVRRVRDLGISGWFILIGLIPFIGGIVLLIGYCLPTDYLKKYGELIQQKLKK